MQAADVLFAPLDGPRQVCSSQLNDVTTIAESRHEFGNFAIAQSKSTSNPPFSVN
jgi:hypothetical protein